MKNPPWILLAMIFLWFGVSSKAQPEPSPQRELEMRLRSASPNYYFVLDAKEFHDTDSLVAFVSKLPAGSVLTWNSGCIQYDTLPLRGPKVQISAFRDSCAKLGIDFRYTCGW